MDRRAFLATLSGSLLATPLAAEAQPAGKVWRIGLFHVGLDHVPPSLDGIRDGLTALGYDTGTSPAPRDSAVIEGKNIRLDWRNLPSEAAARVTAAGFVKDRVDLVVAFENQTVRAAKAAITQIPVVFLHVSSCSTPPIPSQRGTSRTSERQRRRSSWTWPSARLVMNGRSNACFKRSNAVT